MNHGHQFDAALSTERKAEWKRKQAKREARKKLEAAAPDLLDACKIAILALTHEPINPKDIKFIQQAITKAETGR